MEMKNNPQKIITHNGSFHADDVFAAATLSLVLEKRDESFEVIRTRDPEIIKTGDYVFDVGGIYDEKTNRFDHHQLSFEEKRKEGILYSSFGLVWKKFGEELCYSKKAKEIIDNKLVAPIDANDNGFDLVENKYDISPYCIENFFYSMRLTWMEKNTSNGEMFLECVRIAKVILWREIIQAKDTVLAEEKVISIYKNIKDKRIITLDENYSYESVLNNFSEPLFVIYPRADNVSWAIKAIRKNPKSFENRKNLPNSWAGLRDKEFQKITGVQDAVFCHRALFMAVAKTKEGAIKLAELALLA
ncbi:MAG: hypothetical protein UT09_C0031G0002 [Parcubacteria group bacterium GW2011_GWF2_38_8]|nr:MAG: hypothetical protein UT09_C0031G0002 [Parcubacteria group bacterium GW2011_GWF2_38_8]